MIKVLCNFPSFADSTTGSYCRWQEINPTYFTNFAKFTLTIEDAQEYVYSISPTKRVRGWRDIEEKSYFKNELLIGIGEKFICVGVF